MLNKLGKYEIQAVLGQGAMGIVYRAYDPILKRLVALKTLSGDFGQNPELLKRFYRDCATQQCDVLFVQHLGNDDGPSAS